MKKGILNIMLTVGLGLFVAGCGNSSRENAQANDEERTEQSDTTYMESQDNNAQPSTDSDGGVVDETRGAPESGYGNANGTELAPETSENPGAAQPKPEDEK